MSQPTWNTSAGSIGSYPYGLNLSFQFVATPVAPATSISNYILLSGTLPTNLVLSNTGVLSGIPTLVTQNTTTTFTIRANDNLGNIRDRTFSITISGIATPQFTTSPGSLLTTQDSIWTSLQVQYSNPDPDNSVVVVLQEGALPPGLEVSPTGIIQGYPTPPTISVSLPTIITTSLETEATTNYIYCLTIAGMTVGRPVTFTNPIGVLQTNVTYYISSINTSLNAFTVSVSQYGSTYPLTNATGAMTITLPTITTGQPTIRTYSFSLRLLSALGGNTSSFSITVINQNTPVNQGGPGNPPNTRRPTILNTRPLVISPNDSDPYYGYYILPPIAPTQPAQIGTIQTNNYFAFKILGYDFDSNPLTYVFSNLPSWLTGNSTTGWLTGYPVLNNQGINSYSFTVSVRKVENTSITSVNFNFSIILSYDIVGNIIWQTNSDLGTIYNGSTSTLNVSALSDVELNYRIVTDSGSLPPNLQLQSNGDITGIVADQPTDTFLNPNTTTSFTFTVQAYSPDFSIITSNKTFTLNVFQEYSQPTDILYIKAAPSLNDRNLINSLLTSDTLIPAELVYRPNDINFGKATSVIYEHAYGINASAIEQYIEAIKYKNHYWRNITLGELKTAIARNDAGEVLYEVVYSEVIDNLVNPAGTSIESSIYWPRFINLNLGPWYTSVTNIFTSFDKTLSPGFYTSRTPGFARLLYPNSLYNMRNQVADVLGQVLNSTLLPLWMTSQQENGSTLGYTQAWVICYVKPLILVGNTALTYSEFAATGLKRTDYLSCAEIVKDNIEKNWGYTNPQGNFVHYSLNQVNFEIDRFSVNKSATFDWDNNLSPPAWTGLPSATPTPDPIDSKDFYVLFPRQTILPDKTQY